MKVWKKIPVEKLLTAELANGTKIRFVAGDNSNAPAATVGELLPPEDVIKVERAEGGFAIHTFTRHTHQPGQMGPARAEVFIPEGSKVEVYINDHEITEDYLATLDPVGREPTMLDRCRKRLVTDLIYLIREVEMDAKYNTGAFKADLLDDEGQKMGEIMGIGYALTVLIEGLTRIDLHSDEAGGIVATDLSNLHSFGKWDTF